jgi:hypothetical protein
MANYFAVSEYIRLARRRQGNLGQQLTVSHG